jgi:hypothetical protein
MSRTSGVVMGLVLMASLGVAYMQAAPRQNAPAPAGNQRPSPPQASVPAPQPVRTAAASPADHQALVKRYCVTCHNERMKTGGLMLDRMLPELNRDQVSANAETWEKVLGKLRAGAMPPPRVPRPEKASLDAFTSWLETSLDQAAGAKPNPGRAPIHRLNRTEYTNAIRDLLALEIDGRSILPTDESAHGFDNMADVLSMSPGLLERYLIAAQKVSRLAIGDPTMGPVIQTYNYPLTLVQEERMSEDLPMGTRGGAAIRHYFPADGEYVVRIRLQRVLNTSVIRGLANREQLDLRLDGSLIKRFPVGGECVGSKEPRCIKPPGLVTASEYERTADQGLEVRVPVKAGRRVLGLAFVRRVAGQPESASPVRMPAGHSSYAYDQSVEMGVETVQVEGPVAVEGPGDTPSRRAIFVCRPAGDRDEESCAKTILTRLARRAYRRPVTDRDVQTLIGFYRVGRRERGFDTGIQHALERLLVSPEFLYRIEQPLDANRKTPDVYRIRDTELASRLSFFLWSSLPDDELLDLAARGRLNDPVVLKAQVQRMLADKRATALVTDFASQWLYVRNMRVVAPDPEAYPEFDGNLREAFQRETELFLESQLREDRSVVELLTANYTFLNERLARLYGVPNVYGSHFRRVPLNDDRRAGLLGQGSILTVTSYATRTSPVIRGKWLLENILGTPPPPPPANVPPLPENGEPGQAPSTVRARLEQHRKNPVCASCHAPMDPLGFALENFNGIGKWRTSEAGAPIDASGTLPDGSTFNGPAEFRKALLKRSDAFVHTVTEKLLTYALGRGLQYYDMPAVRQIIREAGPDYHWSALVLGIARSVPFQMRTAPATALASSAPVRTLPE